MPAKKSKKKSKTKSTSKTKSRAKPAKKHGTARVKSPKRSPRRKATPKQAVAKSKAKSRKRTPSVNAENELKREFQRRRRTATGTVGPRKFAEFEGTSRAEQADSESVDELVEEGNLFEAGAVAGVEEADDADEREVKTRELPEDDVPEEYLDKD